MAFYKINTRNEMRFDESKYVILSVTFNGTEEDARERARLASLGAHELVASYPSAFTMVELYRVVDGRENFVGYLRGDCTADLVVKGPVARAALDLLVFEEGARA